MYRRPSARYAAPASGLLSNLVSGTEFGTAAAKAAREPIERGEVLALFSTDEELYSVDIARSLGVPVSAAAQVLRRLEEDDRLTSRWQPSPISGNGRRYYRLKLAS